MLAVLLFAIAIELGGLPLEMEIANTPKKREIGLMGRLSLDPEAGMLFVYDQPSILVFWMKNTFIPLSVAFFNEKKELLEILDMPVPPQSAKYYPLYQSTRPASYALEMNRGWFKEHNIVPGMKFTFLD